MPEVKTLLSVGDIQRLAGVSSAAVVSNWRRRYGDTFPEPVAHEGKRPLFEREEIEEWLAEHRGNHRPRRLLPDCTSYVHDLREPARAALAGAAVSAAVLAGYDLHGPVDIDTVVDGFESPLRDAVDAIAAGDYHLLEDVAGRLARDWAETEAALAEHPGDVEASLFERFLLEHQRATRTDGSLLLRTQDDHAHLVAKLVALDAPSGLFDPCVGYGVLLHRVAAELDRATPGVALGGCEIDDQAWAVAVLRLFVHGRDPAGLARTSCFDPGLEATWDTIVCDPPFGSRASDAQLAAMRTPARAGDSLWTATLEDETTDAAWLLRASELVAPGGRAFVLQPLESLTRDGASRFVRNHLVAERGIVEAIVTIDGIRGRAGGAPLALWVLHDGQDRRHRRVLLVDAVDLGTATADRVSDALARWRRAPDDFEPSAGFSAAVEADVLRESGDLPLLPGRWVHASDPAALRAGATAARGELSAAVEDLARAIVPAPSAVPPDGGRRSLGTLIAEGSITVVPGAGDARRMALGAEQAIDPTWFETRDARGSETTIASDEVARAGDVIVYPGPGAARAAVTSTGGFAVGRRLQIWRVEATRVMTPRILAALLQDAGSIRRSTGGTTKHANLRAIEIPHLSPADIERLDDDLRVLEDIESHASSVLRSSAVYRSRLLALLAPQNQDPG